MNFSASIPSKNALAIFCRAPVAGQVKTRLAATHGDEFALLFYRAMLQDTFELARRVGSSPASGNADLFAAFTPDDAFQSPSDGQLAGYWHGPRIPQRGTGLGDRMSACDQELRSRGFEKVVIIGTDSPDLPASILTSTFEALEHVDLVFGRARDGGFYLVGAAGPLRPKCWKNVQWSTPSVLDQVLFNAASLGLRTRVLQVWRDVDEASDLHALCRRLAQGDSFAPRTREFLQSKQLL